MSINFLQYYRSARSIWVPKFLFSSKVRE